MLLASLVLLSGGLDSSLAFVKAVRESRVLYGLTFDYGQKSHKQELAAAERVCRAHGLAHQTLALPFFSEISSHPLFDAGQPLPDLQADELDDVQKTQSSAKSVWVPNRNGVFLNVAAALAEAQGAAVIYVGFNAEEAVTFPDNSAAYLQAVNQSLSFSTLSQIRVAAPTIGMDKRSIVRELIAAGFDFSLLWSCYLGQDKMCGLCESCLRLKRALRENGRDDVIRELFKQSDKK